MVLGMKQQRSPNTYTPKERNLYLTGLLGQNMIYNIIGTGLVFYFQSVLFIPAMATGVIFAIARVWDAINDPMMGTIVDRTNTKWGKCRPYLIFVPAAVCVITILCFCNGIYGSQNSSTVNGLIIAWAGVSYILWGMTYTVGDIPLWGITARMTDDENDRASLLSLARIAGGVGGIVLAIIVPLSQAVGNSLTKSQGLSTQKGQQFGFIIVAVILSVIGCGLFQLSSFAKERVKSSDEHYTIKENFQLMWRNRPFRQIMISSILRAPIMLLMMVAMTLLSYYYGDYNQKSYVVYMIVLGGGIFGGQFIAMAFAPMLVKKFEKKKVYNISSIASGIAFALIFVIYKLAPNKLDQPLWLAICCVVFTIAAAGMGIVNVYQSVMIADTIDYEEYEHGIRPDGVFFCRAILLHKAQLRHCGADPGHRVFRRWLFRRRCGEGKRAVGSWGRASRQTRPLNPIAWRCSSCAPFRPPSACCSPCCRCSIMTCRIKNMQRCSKSCVSAARRRRTRKQSEK